MSSENFYKNLKKMKSIKDIAKDSLYSKIPDDWFIIATDITDSTKAINEGKYKEVNMVGALTIISILNIDKKADLPYVFGGDGSFVLIPKYLEEQTKQALLAVQDIAKKSYDLHLRVGILSIKTLKEKNKELLITKLDISKDYQQAIIKGGALEYVDTLLKTSDEILIKDNIDKNFEVDISGLECRWETVKSPKDDTLSIIIKTSDEEFYANILEDIENVIGDNTTRHPIVEKAIKLSFKNKDLNHEASMYSQNFFFKHLILLKLKFINVLGYALIKNKIGQWGSYKKRVISTTDTEKFDDVLRMVVSTTQEESQRLEEYLEFQYQNQNLTYGIHKSDSALMTCLIFQRHGKHIHFVDGSNGGYALAAKDFKNRVLNT